MQKNEKENYLRVNQNYSPNENWIRKKIIEFKKFAQIRETDLQTPKEALYHSERYTKLVRTQTNMLFPFCDTKCLLNTEFNLFKFII